MTVTELAKRVETLEKEMEYLKSQVSKNGTVEAPNSSTGHKGLHWWHEGQGAGRFADDPEFEEMCRLGREYRGSGPEAAKEKEDGQEKVRMLILDTDLITLGQLKQGEAYRRLDMRLEIAAKTEGIFATIISFEEQTRGWLAQVAAAKDSAKRLRAYDRLNKLLRDYCSRGIRDFDEAANNQFERLRQAKLRIGTMDLKIAAIALAHDATLLSRNLVDFRKVPGLRVEDWTLPVAIEEE